MKKKNGVPGWLWSRVRRRIRELPGKTCIAVTHRPAALQLADWQLSVEPGRITCRELERNI